MLASFVTSRAATIACQVASEAATFELGIITARQYTARARAFRQQDHVQEGHHEGDYTRFTDERTATEEEVEETGHARAARGDDRQGERRESRGGRRSRLRLHREPAAAAARDRRAHRCPGGQDAANAPALREVGDGVLRRGWRLVLRVG